MNLLHRRFFLVSALLPLSLAVFANAQANSTLVDPLLAQHLQSPAVVAG